MKGIKDRHEKMEIYFTYDGVANKLISLATLT